jgi:uncharacterized protein (TIGR03067 family)
MEQPVAAALEGTWQIVKAELAGDEMPAFVAEKIEVELAAGTYTVRFAGDVADRGTYALEAVGKLKVMLLTGLEGSNVGRTIPAIYQLTSDRLRVCYGLDGFVPHAFAMVAGQQRYLAMYRRKT